MKASLGRSRQILKSVRRGLSPATMCRVQGAWACSRREIRVAILPDLTKPAALPIARCALGAVLHNALFLGSLKRYGLHGYYGWPVFDIASLPAWQPKSCGACQVVRRGVLIASGSCLQGLAMSAQFGALPRWAGKLPSRFS